MRVTERVGAAVRHGDGVTEPYRTLEFDEPLVLSNGDLTRVPDSYWLVLPDGARLTVEVVREDGGP